jgi:glycosyltransferase involved in cell wall biosynthesis
MRIAVLVEFFPPNLGSDRRIFEIMRRLAKKHDIHFIVIPPLRLFYGIIDKSGIVGRHFWKKESCLRYKKIRGHFIPISPQIFNLWGGKIGVIAYFLTTIYLFFRALIILRKINPQFIVLNNPTANTGILGLIVGKVLGTRVITDFCDLIAEYSSTLLRIKGIRVKALLMIQRFIVKRSHKIIVTTEFIKQYVKRMEIPSKKIIKIPNGVDPLLFNPAKHSKEMIRNHLGIPIEGKFCVYCGRLDEWAGRKILENIALWFEENNISVKVIVVGFPAEKVQLKNIISLGTKVYKDIPSMLSLADVVLVPFPDEDYAHAASPLKLFEAMAMARPIVASNISGIQEVIKHDESGILVHPNDIEGWCEAILLLLKNSKLSKRLGQCARENVQKQYNWNVLAHQYTQVLLE